MHGLLSCVCEQSVERITPLQGLEKQTRAWLRTRGPLVPPPQTVRAPSVQDDEVQALLSIQTEALLLAEAMQHLEHKLQQGGEWSPLVDDDDQQGSGDE